MSAPQRVSIFTVEHRAANRRSPYLVRRRIDGQDRSTSFRTKTAANAFHAKLTVAEGNGERFDPDTGLPLSMARSAATFYTHTLAWHSANWPAWASNTRRSVEEVIAALLPHHISPGRTACPLPPDKLRAAIREHLLTPNSPTPTGDTARALRWLEQRSLPLTELTTPVVRSGLTILSTKLDGTTAAPNTAKRKRQVYNLILSAAAEDDLIPVNPLTKIKTPKYKQGENLVDRSELIDTIAFEKLLAHDTSGLAPFYALMFYTGCRPSEARGLRWQDLDLPSSGSGTVRFAGSTPVPGKRYTDSGLSSERRSLKARAGSSTRSVPLVPPAVRWLRQLAPGRPEDRIFQTRTGGVVVDQRTGEVWRALRDAGLAAGDRRVPVVYSLRHCCATRWLNEVGLPAAVVARWLGHSVDVLLRTYSHVMEGDEQRARAALDALYG